MSDWRDISTAPKDGTPILIWEPGPHSFGNREKYRRMVPVGEAPAPPQEYDDKRWAVGYWRPWGGWGNRNSADVKPTHWMPLPEPPVTP